MLFPDGIHNPNTKSPFSTEQTTEAYALLDSLHEAGKLSIPNLRNAIPVLRSSLRHSETDDLENLINRWVYEKRLATKMVAAE